MLYAMRNLLVVLLVLVPTLSACSDDVPARLVRDATVDVSDAPDAPDGASDAPADAAEVHAVNSDAGIDAQ
jgi:hypothetical protein